MHKTTHERGFTLIELLVVVAIIGMLSSVVLASMNTARQKARDARRLSDARSLATALEVHYSSNGSQYPAGSYNSTVADTLTGLIPDSISKLPADSTYTGTDGYLYCSTSRVNGYAIAIQREQTGWCQYKEGTGCNHSNWETDTLPICSQ